MKKIKKENLSEGQNFEDIKHIDEFGKEFLHARELMISLGYLTNTFDTTKNVQLLTAHFSNNLFLLK